MVRATRFLHTTVCDIAWHSSLCLQYSYYSVIQGLLLLGATPGAAVAYLIAGPATNFGELNAIRNSMGIKPAVYYVAALFIVALVAGLVTDQLVFPNYQYHAFRVEGELVVQQCCVPLIFGKGVNSLGMTSQLPNWH